MICAVCKNEFERGESVAYNHRDSFIFKPTNVPDTVNPAKVSQEELLESRKDHVRTAVATSFIVFGDVAIPQFAFNVTHTACSVQRTGGALSGAHPAKKHSIRFTRSATRRVSR